MHSAAVKSNRNTEGNNFNVFNSNNKKMRDIELRIGNEFKHKTNGYYLNVESITSMGVSVTSPTTGESHKVRYDDICPIEINNEWLRDIGLRQVGHMIEGNFYLPNGRYIIGNVQSDGKRTLEIVLGDNEFFITNRCNYRHELCNLYYDLCGELLVNKTLKL